MSELDEVEYARLAARVQELEKLVSSGAPGSAGVLLGNFLSNVKSRMEEILHEEGRFEETEKSRKEKETAMAVELAEMEHRLSAQEKERYAGFLELEYFKKANFEDLEVFYADSWDRLSESGKNQMSVRVWGGIRRHEYNFDELPEKMREKESERIYLQLTGAIEPNAGLHSVQPQAKAEFVREYEAGNEKATSKILSGDGFAGYSPDARKETSDPDVSMARKNEAAVTSQTKHPQVTKDPEAVMEGFMRTDSGPVSPSRLPASTGSAVGKG